MLFIIQCSTNHDCKFFFSGILFLCCLNISNLQLQINRVEKKFVCCCLQVKIIACGFSLSMKVGKHVGNDLMLSKTETILAATGCGCLLWFLRFDQHHSNLKMFPSQYGRAYACYRAYHMDQY